MKQIKMILFTNLLLIYPTNINETSVKKNQILKYKNKNEANFKQLKQFNCYNVYIDNGTKAMIFLFQA